MPRNDERLVRFRYRIDRASPTVEVRGEMQHWLYPSQMEAAGDGWAEHAFRLGAGTYQYKFRTGDHAWVLDPANPRTRARDGTQNSLLVVDGADEPVLHAPARPYLFEEDDGRVCIRAGLRRGSGDRLALRWDEGAGIRRDDMRLVAHEDEHLIFEAHVPGAGRQLEYVFALADGRLIGAPGGGAQTFRIARDGLRSRTPAWWRDAVLYTIFVDRFRARGGTWTDTTTDREHRAGGDLHGVIEALPYLVDLGVTALHLTPICLAPSVHRYDAIDPRAVAPELGGDDALARLLDAAHAANLRVLLDVAITHVHRDFAPFRDVRDRGRDSSYWSWFSIQNHPFFEGYDPGYAHYQKGQWQEPLLRMEEPEVIEYLVDTFVHWTKRGADGFRIDAAADVPRSVVAQIARGVRAANKQAALFAEYIPDNIVHWTAEAADAATDFVAQQALYDWLWRRTAGASRVAEINARRRFDRGGPGWTAIAFTATHDQPRFRTLVQDARIARLAQLYVLMRPAIPALYYGDEIGLRADEPARSFEDSWPDRQCMPWDSAAWDRETFDLTRSAIALRRSRPALSRGDEHALDVGETGGEEVVAFRRTHGNETIDVVLNGGPTARRIRLPAAAISGARVLLALAGATIEDARSRPRDAGSAFPASDIGAIKPPDATGAFPSRDVGEINARDAAGATAHAAAGALSSSDIGEIKPRHAAAHDATGDALHAGAAPHDAAGAHRNAAGEGGPTYDASAELVLPPWSALVIERVPVLAEDALDDASALAHNRLLGAMAYRAGATESPAYPAHLYVTITEACNLRCRHCITHAPELTQSGRARAIRPWLIDALRDAFAAADYFAFAHGGESLTSPGLFDVLSAISRAHAGKPGSYNAHLLTNGMLLLADTTKKLIDHGVTSIMVSLDGATAATNDTIRLGGRLDTVRANIRDAIRIRRETNADLRLGISTVIGATNLDELTAIARLAIELEVDWLKLEETYPATPFARRDLIKPASIAPHLPAVRELLAASNVVLVDHVEPPSGCPCEAARRPDGAAIRAFRDADDFANRTRFSPCRAAWEQACVDPDGTVHPIDYFHPPLGNLQDSSFLDLWNGHVAQRLRARALSRISPEIRSTCPLEQR